MGEFPDERQPDIETLLRSASAGRRRRGWLVWALLLVLVAGAVLWLARADAPEVRWITEPARRGDLTVIVTATGALEPTNEVDVGTEVSGTIETVLVEANERVAAGQVLARLDTERLEAAVAQSRAALASARARLAEAEATADEVRQRLGRLERVAARSAGELVSAEELTAARAAVARAEAGIATARAAIVEAEARLSSDRANLDRAIIRAPIAGVVLTREVEPGQTVAATLQTPVLFTLAESLERMELRVAVDEADVGQVAPGQPATFTVAAYPDREFPAVIESVRFAPTATAEGVVTYEALLAVANDDLLLRPGMTATADVVVAQRDDVLLVANAALRFEPPAPAAERGFSLVPRPPHGDFRPPRARSGDAVWVLAGELPEKVPVVTGASDGVVTEVVSGDVAAGEPVLVDYELPAGAL